MRLQIAVTLAAVLLIGLAEAQGNGRNSKKHDCLGNKRERLRQHFSEASMDAICERQAKWMHEANRPDRIPRPSEMSTGSMKDRINQILNKPPKPQDASVRGRRGLRKEYRMLSETERNTLHNAINVLKNFKLGNSNIYDSMANIHQPHIVPGAHWGAAFLGWHKQYLLMMEDLLQVIDPSIMLPYWDSTLDSHLGDQAGNSIMWSSEFLGNRDGDVVTGPFAGWTVPRPTEGRYTLWRRNGSIGRMINEDDIDYLIAIDNYRNLTWHVDPYYEMVHGEPHLWVGGPMGTITAAAFDPVFWMHHGFIDLIWDAQRDRVYRSGGRRSYTFPGLDDDEAYGVGEVQDPFADVPLILDEGRNSAHYRTKQLFPFPMKNSDSLTEEYKRIYRYQPRPTCSSRRPDCGSPYLFCIRGSFKCAPKLQIGADCSNFTYSDPCYKGNCLSGVCQGVSADDNYLSQFLQFLFALFQQRF